MANLNCADGSLTRLCEKIKTESAFRDVVEMQEFGIISIEWIDPFVNCDIHSAHRIVRRRLLALAGELISLPFLRVLSRNQLKGTLPSVIGQLTRLTRLYVSDRS
jgi:hypothetical protein